MFFFLERKPHHPLLHKTCHILQLLSTIIVLHKPIKQNNYQELLGYDIK